MPMTSAALPPELALDYLRALSTDIRGAAILTEDGVLLAGDPDVAVQAAGVTGAADVPAGRLQVARGDGHVVAVLTGPHALAGVLAEDLRTVLGDLPGR